MTQVVLIRPWTDARAGGGCCSGEVRDGVAPGVSATPHCHDEADVVGATYRLLRRERPDVDVQVVGAGNTLWLLPTVFRAVRRREGAVAAVGAALRANRAGAVIVDGDAAGDIEDLGPEGVLLRLTGGRPGRADLDVSAGRHPASGDVLR